MEWANNIVDFTFAIKHERLTMATYISGRFTGRPIRAKAMAPSSMQLSISRIRPTSISRRA